MDRCSESITYGCLDRSFWHYKAVTDFPGATWQQAVFGLALLYKHPFPGNIFCGSPLLLRWIEAALLWSGRIQNRDGSWSEWYHNERSFCATAYTTWTAARAVAELDGDLSRETRRSVLDALVRGGEWLCRHDNPNLGNQMAASLAALSALCRLTGEERFHRGRDEKKRWLVASQHSEGWLPEYGGADVGYSFVALDSLSDACRTFPDEDLREAARRLAGWLSPLVHSDGAAGGSVGSRGGDLFLPAGIASSAEDSSAAYLLSLWRKGTESGASAGPLTVDDRYLASFFFNSLVRAAIDVQGRSTDRDAAGFLPAPFTFYREAGLVALHDREFTFVSGLKGGACFRVTRVGKAAWEDSGYIVSDDGGRSYVSQGWKEGGAPEVRGSWPGEVTLTAGGAFRLWDRNRPVGARTIAFKAAGRVLFALPPVEALVSRRLKKSAVTGREYVPITLERTFFLEAGRLTVNDVIVNRSGRRLKRIVPEPAAFLSYSPTSRFRTGLLEVSPAAGDLSERVCDIVNRTGKVSLRSVIPLTGSGTGAAVEIVDD